MKKKKTNGIRQRSPGWGGGACRTPLQDPPRQHVVPSPACCKTAPLCMLLPDKPNGPQPGGEAWLQIISTLTAIPQPANLTRRKQKPKQHELSWQRRRSAAFLGAGLLDWASC